MRTIGSLAKLNSFSYFRRVIESFFLITGTGRVQVPVPMPVPIKKSADYCRCRLIGALLIISNTAEMICDYAHRSSLHHTQEF